MKVVEPGREYELAGGSLLRFVRADRVAGSRPGATNEEVIEVLIDRLTDAYQRLPCHETIRAMHCLREALAALNLRTANRARMNVEGTLQPHRSRYEPTRGFGLDYPDDVANLDFAPN